MQIIMTDMTNPHRHSHSSFQLWRDCQMKHHLQRDIRLELRGGRDNHDLLYGSAYHEALAVLYAQEGDYVASAGERFKSTYPAKNYPAETYGKSRANGLSSLWTYVNTVYADDMERYDVLEVERLHGTEGLGEYDHTIVLDVVLRDKGDGLIYGVDHKITGSYLDDGFWGRFDPSSQVRMYVNDLKRRYGSCGGFMINAISLRNRSRAYTPRKGPEKGVPQPAGDWFKFGRMLYKPNRDALAAEERNVAVTIGQIERARTSGQYTYNTERCHAGTRFECEYYRICQPGYTWPEHEEIIGEYYRRTCGGIIAGGRGRCRLDRGHAGGCSPDVPREPELPRQAVDIREEDWAEYEYNAVEEG